MIDVGEQSLMSDFGVELFQTRIAYMTIGRAATIEFEGDPETLRPLQTGYRREAFTTYGLSI